MNKSLINKRGQHTKSGLRSRGGALGRDLSKAPPDQQARGRTTKTAGPPKISQITPPAQGCTPPAGRTLKRKETCIIKDRVATKVKRRRNGY